MRNAGYGLLVVIAGCSQGMCRGTSSDPTPVTAPSAVSSVATAVAPSEGEQEALGEQIEPLRRGGRTLAAEPPRLTEEPGFRAWVAAAVLAAQNGEPAPYPSPPGFVVRGVPDRNIWLLTEEDTRRRGAGVIALRVGPAAPLLVEAPHTFFDQGTLPIALAVFEAQRARALIISTSHRYGGRPKPTTTAARDADADDEGEGASEPAPSGSATVHEPLPEAVLAFADVAHAERSFFLTAHKALLDSLPGLPTVQLHGFQDSSAPGAGVIASGVGGAVDLARLLGPLRAAVPDVKVLAYPKEIAKLGGASNMQSRWSRQAGAPFYHLEISRTLRDRLVAERPLLRRFAAAFSDVATLTPKP